MDKATKVRVLIVVRKLGIGGAEKVLVNVANNLDKSKFEVTVCYLEDGDYRSLVQEHVKLVKLKSKNAMLVPVELSWLFTKNRFDVVLHSWPKLAVFWFLISPFLGSKMRTVKKIIRVPISLSTQIRVHPLLNSRLFKSFFSKVLNYHDAVVALCEDMSTELKNEFHILADKLTVIYNPIDATNVRTKAAEFNPFDGTAARPVIVSAGRLEYQKGFDILLEAFRIALDTYGSEFERARLVILGRGRELRKLKALALSLGLSERVNFVDWTPNPYPYLKNADVFVLPSRYEGFPNVLIEALACGAKVVSTNCPTGPAEILGRDERFGWLAETDDPHSLAAKIVEALHSPPKKSDDALDRFSLERIVAQYESLLSAVVRPKVAFFTSDLGSGGSQRVLSTFARYLKHLGVSATVIALRGGPYKEYLDTAGVHCTVLDVRRARASVVEVHQVLKELRPDVVVASLVQDALVITTLKRLGLLKAKFVYRPSNQVERIFPKGFWKMVGALTFRTADLVIFQTERMREKAEMIFPVLRRKSFVLPNPVDFDYVIKMSEEFNPFSGTEDTVKIVSVGRLTFQKGFDVLLRAFARVRAKIQNAVLFVLGDGEERMNLENLANELGVRDFVRFVGWVNNPYPYYRHADVFVLASRYEGTPNALLEALACGAKVVATDCPTGPREIIGSGERCGWLAPVDDDQALAEKILQALSSQGKAGGVCLEFYDARRLARKFFEKVLELSGTSF